MASLLFPVPWDWFSDPPWLIVANLLFWPTYVGYVVARDRLEQRSRRRRFQRAKSDA